MHCLLTAQATSSPQRPRALPSPAWLSEVSACEVIPVLSLNGRVLSVREIPLSADMTLGRSGRDACPYGFELDVTRNLVT